MEKNSPVRVYARNCRGLRGLKTVYIICLDVNAAWSAEGVDSETGASRRCQAGADAAAGPTETPGVGGGRKEQRDRIKSASSTEIDGCILLSLVQFTVRHFQGIISLDRFGNLLTI